MGINGTNHAVLIRLSMGINSLAQRNNLWTLMGFELMSDRHQLLTSQMWINRLKLIYSQIGKLYDLNQQQLEWQSHIYIPVHVYYFSCWKGVINHINPYWWLSTVNIGVSCDKADLDLTLHIMTICYALMC